MPSHTPSLERALAAVSPTPARPVVVLTGAGVSAASGIPTFRGPEGYWTVGSRSYRPQELATQAAFLQMPREVWRWYLYRKGVCNRAAPNVAHDAIATLEVELGDAMHLITQNVDGLHARAGSTRKRTSEIHGSIDWMRDLRTGALSAIPPEVVLADRDAVLTDEAFSKLEGHRPHVLWFDEYYDEAFYRADTAMRHASSASVLVICGTSGAASLPWRAAEAAVRAGALIVDVSPDDNPFRSLAERYDRGHVLDGVAVDGLPRLVRALTHPSG